MVAPGVDHNFEFRAAKSPFSRARFFGQDAIAVAKRCRF
jgi:hypothetical protein